MKNKLVIYANVLKDNLTREGCSFIMQKAEPISRSILMQFNRNNVQQNIINRAVEVLKCIHMVELGKDTLTILLQEEI